jgi:hypothetical protein
MIYEIQIIINQVMTIEFYCLVETFILYYYIFKRSNKLYIIFFNRNM